MTEIRPVNGMVGFFDILGYTSFLENNEPEVAASTVLEMMVEAPKKVSALHTSLFEGHVLQPELQSFLTNINWLVFSDTLLATSGYRSDTDNGLKVWDWAWFASTMVVLYRYLFDGGLPVRGALSFGRHVLKEQCFVGRPIIDAYHAAHDLDLAAVTLHSSALSELDAIGAHDYTPAIVTVLTTEYLTPLRTGESAKLRLLKPSFRSLPPARTGDVRQFVANSFWMHKKDIAPGVVTKLNNTEQFFRFCLMRWPDIFGKAGK